MDAHLKFINNLPYKDQEPIANQRKEAIKLLHVSNSLGYKSSISKIRKDIRRSRLCSARLEASSSPRTEWVPTNNQKGRFCLEHVLNMNKMTFCKRESLLYKSLFATKVFYKESIGKFPGLAIKHFPAFLAHLSRRLEWAIVIAHRPSSVRKLFTFSTSSPEPLDGFWWNFVGMKYSWSLTSVVVFRPDPPGANPGRGQNRSRGSPSSRNFFFRPEGYSDKPNA